MIKAELGHLKQHVKSFAYNNPVGPVVSQPALVDGDHHRHPVPDAVGVRPRHLPLSRAGLAPPRLLHARTRLLRPPHLRLRLRHSAPRNHREGHLLHVSLIKRLEASE